MTKYAAILLISLSLAAPAYAESDGVRYKGVEFNVENDRQFVRVGGVHQPEGMDAYNKRYFDKLSRQIAAVQAQNEELKKAFEELKALVKASLSQQKVFVSEGGKA